MNPIWAILFKDRFRTPFSVYRMSFAEIVVLLGLVAGAGIGVAKGISWILELEGETSTIDTNE
jgi:hypothetical protein|tara:strand:+ start:395 stop:583 length:189 start_codon:yes stop_codon:yes gene_type:complete